MATKGIERMFYHYILSWHEVSHMTDHDLTEEEIIQNIVVPVLGRQIKMWDVNGLGLHLFNLGTISRMTITKTTNKLTKSQIKKLTKGEQVGENCTSEIVDRFRSDLSAIDSKSLISLAAGTPKKQIFVIMKISDKELDSAYELAIKPLGNRFGYKIFRIDDIHDSSVITDQIISSIAESEIIIADLTRERPNCYYETGFAQALGKELVLTIKKGERKHFDLASHRFIEWETAVELKRELEERLEAIMEKRSAVLQRIKR